MSDGLIFDHHALLAAGRGDRTASAYIVAAHEDPLFTLLVPGLCLAEATRRRPETSAHIAQMPAVEVSAVDRLSADLMGRLGNTEFPAEGWPVLHAVSVSLATGWEIATTTAETYKGFGVPLMPIPA
ncbi:hypothetical protein [Streptomyces synnematoformans]|uniref:PIN domain-containing protein n=1 Tax=Streptomyces synnematoformans TaxID=415721 RepID=A0ABN2YPX8_9ACTN